jgi:hypothetical protein
METALAALLFAYAAALFGALLLGVAAWLDEHGGSNPTPSWTCCD